VTNAYVAPLDSLQLREPAMQPTGKSRFLLACLALFAGCIASLGWQADWRSGSAWYALLYSELFVLALILAWLQKALHLLSGMPRAEVFHEVLGRILTWRAHQAMGIASLGLRDPGLVLVSWLVLSALTEAAGSAIDSFVKETDRKHAGEELIRSPRPSELKASARTVRTLQETAFGAVALGTDSGSRHSGNPNRRLATGTLLTIAGRESK